MLEPGDIMGLNDRLQAPPDFDGPVRDRKCTDIIFTILIVCLWVAMTAVGADSIKNVSCVCVSM